MTAPARTLVEALLPWYARSARDLPWRRNPSPYRTLLSELMLQQTRVDTVIPYFERFVARWPTVEALAAADLDEVLHAWAGLGYYSRARNLHRCAVAAASSGGIPRTVDALRALPGIGPYTAGAVASIAFGERTPLVDGNVERVISRLDARDADPRSGEGKKALWARATELVLALAPGEHPGDLNQALMELGATVCLPRNPSCLVCPARALCGAAASGEPERFPATVPRQKPLPALAAYGLVWRGGWVVGRRPPGLLGGLWEPIGTDLDEGAEPLGALHAALWDRAGLVAEQCRELGVVRHTFSHRKLTARVFAVEASGEPTTGAWYTEVAILHRDELALSKLARKLLAAAPDRG